jgi:hypothetical protein
MHSFTIALISTLSLGVHAASIGDSVSQVVTREQHNRLFHNPDFTSADLPAAESFERAGKISPRQFVPSLGSVAAALSGKITNVAIGNTRPNTVPQAHTVDAVVIAQDAGVNTHATANSQDAINLQAAINAAIAASINLQAAVNSQDAISLQVAINAAITAVINLQAAANSPDAINAAISIATTINLQTLVNSQDAINLQAAINVAIAAAINLQATANSQDVINLQAAINAAINLQVAANSQDAINLQVAIDAAISIAATINLQATANSQVAINLQAAINVAIAATINLQVAANSQDAINIQAAINAAIAAAINLEAAVIARVNVGDALLATSNLVSPLSQVLTSGLVFSGSHQDAVKRQTPAPAVPAPALPITLPNNTGLVAREDNTKFDDQVEDMDFSADDSEADGLEEDF